MKKCTRCAIWCGVHGFAMSPYDSFSFATAPYYREARVTVARRQTACRMRHCCARHIEQCLGRRKLVSTSTRWAERQRIIEAEASRIANPNAASPRAGSAIGKHCSSLSCPLAMQTPFFWTGDARFLSRERKWGVWSCRPQAAFLSARCAEFNPQGDPPSSLR